METIEEKLREAIVFGVRRMRALPPGKAAQPPAPGKWSPKQIVGHLIDSASNNHQRFVRAQFTGEYTLLPYEQERWVAAQRYEDAEWEELIEFWELYNAHLARVIHAVPDDVRRGHHILMPDGTRMTLEALMADYLRHVTHHLDQIPEM